MYSKLTPVSRARPDAVDAAKNTMAVNRLPFSLNRPLSCCCWSCRHCLPTNNYPTCHCIAERPDQLAVSSEGYLVAISRYLDDFSMFFFWVIFSIDWTSESFRGHFAVQPSSKSVSNWNFQFLVSRHRLIPN